MAQPHGSRCSVVCFLATCLPFEYMKSVQPLRQRRSIRRRGYDYSNPGAYFITICAFDRQHLFGEVIQGHMRLNELGKIIEKCWFNIPHHFPNVLLDEFVCMPNHLHGIIVLWKRHGDSLAKEHRRDTPWRVPTEQFGKPRRGSLSTIVRLFKSSATKTIREATGYVGPIWQSRFFDHIIRNDHSLNRIRNYIRLNPSLWRYDRNNQHRTDQCSLPLYDASSLRLTNRELPMLEGE